MRRSSQSEAPPKMMFPNQAAMNGGSVPDLPSDIALASRGGEAWVVERSGRRLSRITASGSTAGSVDLPGRPWRVRARSPLPASGFPAREEGLINKPRCCKNDSAQDELISWS